jgi:tripartite-type tricarboxylate transporter receptor subunit TctC
MIHPSLPVKSVPELIAYAKANPGKLNFASSNNAARLAGALFEFETGTTMLTVPYKGAAAAMTAMAGGETNVTLNGLFVALPHIKGGKVTGIGVASPKRMAAAPELPTVIEGGVPNFVTGSFQGLLAPAGTPKAIVDKINATVVQIIRTPEMTQKLTGMGAEVIGGTPAEFGSFLKEDSAKWVKVAKAANIKPE